MTNDERTHALQRNVTQLQQQLSDLHEQLAAEGRRSSDWQQQLADSRIEQLAQVLHGHMLMFVFLTSPFPQSATHTHWCGKHNPKLPVSLQVKFPRDSLDR